jgi:hypothetical protein
MKKIIVALLTIVALLSVFAFSVSAEESSVPETSVEVSDDASIEASAEEKDDMDVDLDFKGFGSDGFLRNIKYMGLGMLGIFVVVGVVMVVTNVLNAVTSRKK